MNKRAVFIICLILLIVVFGICIYIGVRDSNEDNNELEENIINSSSLEDIKQNLTNDTIEIVSTEERTTPNTILILKKEYLDCAHTIIKEMQISEELVNLTKEELQAKYENWKIEEFSEEQVVLKISLDSFCGEHYLLLEDGGYISVYTVDEEGNKELKEITDISTDYLPETDRISLQNGLMIYGTEELNKVLEDFE